MPINLQEIEGAFDLVEGIPHPNWTTIYDWIEQRNYREGELREAWEQAALQWLDELRRTLPKGYDIYESDNFLTLSAEPEKKAMRFLAFAEQALKHVRDSLGDVTADEGMGKHVILSLHDTETYDRYLCRFVAEGEHADSAGVFLNEYYGHFVLRPAEDEAVRSTVVHELTHACLRHLPIPLWLNEALAMSVEGGSPGTAFRATLGVTSDAEGVRKLREHWKTNGLEPFWSGEGFGAVKHQCFSYPLAQILFGLLQKKGQKPLTKFILEAKHDDGGREAARKHLGEDLEKLVEAFLS